MNREKEIQIVEQLSQPKVDKEINKKVQNSIDLKAKDVGKQSIRSNDDEPAEQSISDCSMVGDRAVVFSLNNQVGGLVRALRIFQVANHFVRLVQHEMTMSMFLSGAGHQCASHRVSKVQIAAKRI